MRENQNGLLRTDPAAQRQYATVAAGQTAQLLGATGAATDELEGLLITPETTSPGHVIILDGATPITVFAGGATSVADLKPFWVPIGAAATGAGWSVTTGANILAIAVGRFT